jgi:hypothetical protein
MRYVAASLAVVLAVAIIVERTPVPRGARFGIGFGPGAACALPPRVCDEKCDDLVQIAVDGAGYVDGRLDDENTPESSTSYLRRDLMMAVQYAAARVECKARGWPTGNGGPIVLGDMSERDGSTPGTRRGRPRHPHNTHVAGRDIDIAYFQRGTQDNQLRPICRHADGDIEEFRCIGPPIHLDAYRTAMLIGALLEDTHVRVIGVDARAARPIRAAFRELCDADWIDPDACANDRVTYESVNSGRGWYRGHHNHLHVSWTR